MDIKKRVEDSLSQPLTRREFLARSSTLALAVLGITAMLRSLGKPTQRRPAGYGSSVYNGKVKF